MNQSWLSAPPPTPLSPVLGICLHFRPTLKCRFWAPSYPLFWSWEAAPHQFPLHWVPIRSLILSLRPPAR